MHASSFIEMMKSLTQHLAQIWDSISVSPIYSCYCPALSSFLIAENKHGSSLPFSFANFTPLQAGILDNQAYFDCI